MKPAVYWNRQSTKWWANRPNFEISYWPIILEDLAQQKQGRVLEIGCGIGRLYPKVKEMDHQYFGVDIAEDAIELAKRTYPEIRYNFECGDFRQLLLGVKWPIDYVVCSCVLDHLEKVEPGLKVLLGIGADRIYLVFFKKLEEHEQIRFKFNRFYNNSYCRESVTQQILRAGYFITKIEDFSSTKYAKAKGQTCWSTLVIAERRMA